MSLDLCKPQQTWYIRPPQPEDHTGEEQRDQEEREEEHGQRLQRRGEGAEQELKPREPAQQLEHHDRRNEDHDRGGHGSLVVRRPGQEVEPQGDLDGDEAVDQVVEAEEEDAPAGADHEAGHDVQQEEHLRSRRGRVEQPRGPWLLGSRAVEWPAEAGE